LKTKFHGRNLNLWEILDNVSKEETVDDKVAVLKMFDNKVLRWYVNSLYNKDWLNFKIPEHKTPIYQSGLINMISASKKLDLIYENKDNPKMIPKLQVLLESLSLDDYNVIISMIQNKKNPDIHKRVFKRAFPEFFRLDSEVEEV